MLKSISITNFQSHRNTHIDFSEGLNVISGSSDSGKSSVVRAIRWVLENRPSGDSVRNWNCDKKEEMCVDIEFAEGSVSKKKIEGKTKYLIDSKKGSFEFEAVRSDVPQEALDIFNLSEFNIQTQHDPYFLLNDSPGEVAKKLNYLVGLDVIDTIFKNLNSKISLLKRNIEAANSAVSEFDSRIKSLLWIEEADKELTSLENEEESIKNDRKKYEQINEIINRYDLIRKETDKIQPLIKIESCVSDIDRELNGLDKNRKKYSEILLIVQNIEKINSEVISEGKFLKAEKNCGLVKKEVLDYISDRQRLAETNELVNLVLRLKQESDLELSGIKNNREALNEIFAKNRICPFCGSEITDKKIKDILK